MIYSKEPAMRRFILLLACALRLSAASVRIYQTNSAGDAVDVIDPATNKVIMQVKDIEVPHGVAFSPDGKRAYISCEAESTLWSVDTKTGKLIAKAPLSGHPNNIAISKDGRRVFVAIVTQPGAVDVIDTAAMKNIKTIAVKGGVHNTYVTPDGKVVLAGSIVGKMLTAIDPNSLEILWEKPFDLGVRPIAFEKAPDGSTAPVHPAFRLQRVCGARFQDARRGAADQESGRAFRRPHGRRSAIAWDHDRARREDIVGG